MKARDVTRPRPRLTNKWHPCPKWHTKIFCWYGTFTTVPIVFISIFRPESPYCEEYVCVCVCVYIYIYINIYIYREREREREKERHTSDCVETVYDYCCYQTLLRVEHFCTNRERCEVLTGYLSPGRRLGGVWVNT